MVKNPAYDSDGNMTDTGDGTRYAWDAENRLIRVTKPGGTEIRYTYDGDSRRIRREVYHNNVLQTATRHLYDGWNVIAEFVGASLVTPSAPTTIYTWGLYLSGSLQGAGGVGGLLDKQDTATGNVYNYTYDGNGNVSELLSAADNAIAAYYEYDAFGKSIVSTGAQAASNTYRFSTKPLDEESNLYYYGYRFYDPNLGRWPNRDPIAERGGKNLYGIVSNSIPNHIDFLGYACYVELKIPAYFIDPATYDNKWKIKSVNISKITTQAGGIRMSFGDDIAGSAGLYFIMATDFTWTKSFYISCKCDRWLSSGCSNKIVERKITRKAVYGIADDTIMFNAVGSIFTPPVPSGGTVAELIANLPNVIVTVFGTILSDVKYTPRTQQLVTAKMERLAPDDFDMG